MPETSYQDYHRNLITTLAEKIRSEPPFNGGELDDLHKEFLHKLDEVTKSNTDGRDISGAGQWLITTIVGRYHHITPLIPRSLFWYFGGDCLHYLGDEEIHYFQQLDEAFHDALAGSGEILDYERLMHSFDSDGQSHLH